jgi:hypothetical protein
MASLAAGPVAVAQSTEPCLGPDVTEALQTLLEARRLPSSSPGGLQLERLDVKGSFIEMGYSSSVSVVLVPTGSTEGRRFDVRFIDPQHAATPEDRAALLEAARTVDAAIPSATMRRCRSPAAAESAPRECVVPALIGIGAGWFEIAVVLAALGLGLSWTWRRASETGSCSSRDSG